MSKNIKIDSDNKSINIIQPVKKGKDGVDGYTPQKDIDYLSIEKTEKIIDDKIEAVELKAVESSKNDLSLVEYNLTNAVDSIATDLNRVVKQAETEKILKDIAVNTLQSEIEATDKVVEEHINNSDIHFDDLEQKNKVIDLIDKPVVVNNYSGGGGISEVRVNRLINDAINQIDTTELDPIFIASPAGSITANDISGWNNKLSSYTETDPVFTSWIGTNPLSGFVSKAGELGEDGDIILADGSTFYWGSALDYKMSYDYLTGLQFSTNSDYSSNFIITNKVDEVLKITDGTNVLDITAKGGITSSTGSINLGDDNLTTTGKLGIGTVAPTTRFHLAGTTTAHFAQIDTGINFYQVVKASAPTATLIATDTGNVTNGYHRYAVTFVTPLGETDMEAGTRSNIILVDDSNKQVQITNIPISTDYRVTKRRLYRTIYNVTYPLFQEYYFKFLAEINDNVTTTYTDNTADGSLTGGLEYPGYYYVDNTTNGFLSLNSSKVFYSGIWNLTIGTYAGSSLSAPANGNTFVGINSGRDVTVGSSNTAFGSRALATAITAGSNTAVGRSSLDSTKGTGNTAVGNYAGAYITTGTYNTAIGNSALRHSSYSSLTTGIQNVALGYLSMAGAVTSASYNTSLGTYSGGSLTTGNSNIFLGYNSGYRQTTNSNCLIIDNQQRADVATEASNSIIYGVMDALTANQTLRFNANVGINKVPTVALDVVGAGAFTTTVSASGFNIGATAGVSGTFVSADATPKTITVTNGIITSII